MTLEGALRIIVSGPLVFGNEAQIQASQYISDLSQFLEDIKACGFDDTEDALALLLEFRDFLNW